MKLHNILKFLVFIFISSGVYAQGFYSYKLFDNEFQAIFPGEPTEQRIPNEYKKLGIKAYQYGDSVNQLAFSSQSQPSSLQYDVGEYKQSTKQMLDESISMALKDYGHKIINFSSTFNQKENTYVAVYTSSYFTEGLKRYSSTKQIIYKKKVYKWTVMYPSLNDKYIFDNNQEYCKIIK